MSPEQRAFVDEMMGKVQRLLPEREVRSEGFGFTLVKGNREEGRIELENLFLMVQHRPEKADQMVTRWLDELRAAMSGRHRGGSFDSVKDDLFLAVRPIQMYEEATARNGTPAMAFCWPVTPELGIYWAIDQGGSIGYVTQKQFDSWDMNEEEVTKVAYENTVSAEADMIVDVHPKGGLLISSRSRFETLAHLLYWPPNLEELLQRHAPELRDQILLLNVALPFRMMIVHMNYFSALRRFQEDQLQEHGRVMSGEVYTLHGCRLIGKIGYAVGGEKLIAFPFENYGLGLDRLEKIPYEPGELCAPSART